MTTQEQIKIYAAYLPYNVAFSDLTCDMPNKLILDAENFPGVLEDATHLNTIRLHLYDLSHLTKEIQHEGRVFTPIDVFEITDDHDSYSVEYDHGNIKLIRSLEAIAENSSYYDIQFLPFEVVQRLISWHFNIYQLPAGEFIDKATLKIERND